MSSKKKAGGHPIRSSQSASTHRADVRKIPSFLSDVQLTDEEWFALIRRETRPSVSTSGSAIVPKKKKKGYTEEELLKLEAELQKRIDDEQKRIDEKKTEEFVEWIADLPVEEAIKAMRLLENANSRPKPYVKWLSQMSEGGLKVHQGSLMAVAGIAKDKVRKESLNLVAKRVGSLAGASSKQKEKILFMLEQLFRSP